MKKIAITLSLMLFIGLGMSFGQCNKSNDVLSSNKGCCSKAKTEKCQSETEVADTDVMVYYFHATRRCATCESVEKVTKETLKEKYGEKVAFKSINREENKDNPLVKKYKINAQTLLVVKGEETVDLTTKAFLNAKSSPEKLEKDIIATVDKML